MSRNEDVFTPLLRNIPKRSLQLLKRPEWTTFVLFSFCAIFLFYFSLYFHGEPETQTSSFLLYSEGNNQEDPWRNWSQDWSQYIPDDRKPKHFGHNFQHLAEKFLLEILGDDELPRPRFVGSGYGEGTFSCKDFADKWDQLNCLQSSRFLDDMLDLGHKNLASYLLALVADPDNIEDIVGSTGSLGGDSALGIQDFYNGYGNVPYDLVRDFGGGSGSGFQIYCNGTMLISMGGGGGGGIEFNIDNRTFEVAGGGGGGVQVFDPSDNTTFASLGGGQGTPNYTANVDQDANVTEFQRLWPEVRETIRNCPREILHLHGGGGGGAGIAVNNMEESYLWKYFYFYFEFGSDRPSNREISEDADGDSDSDDDDLDSDYENKQKQDNFCHNPEIEKYQNDYCLNIPEGASRDHCETQRREAKERQDEKRRQRQLEAQQKQQ